MATIGTVAVVYILQTGSWANFEVTQAFFPGTLSPQIAILIALE
jgi:hypothetical protein